MTSHSSAESVPRLLRRIDRARAALNAAPWWRPIKRQSAAREYRYALLAGALAEAADPWTFHFYATDGHSCGQVGKFYHCPACGWKYGIDPRVTPPGAPAGGEGE